MLWQQLPDNVDDMTDQCTIAQVSSGNSAQASVLCPGIALGSAELGVPQVPKLLTTGSDCLVIYSDGSLQGAGSGACCGGAGIVVLDEDRPL